MAIFIQCIESMTEMFQDIRNKYEEKFLSAVFGSHLHMPRTGNHHCHATKEQCRLHPT